MINFPSLNIDSVLFLFLFFCLFVFRKKQQPLQQEKVES